MYNLEGQPNKDVLSRLVSQSKCNFWNNIFLMTKPFCLHPLALYHTLSSFGSPPLASDILFEWTHTCKVLVKSKPWCKQPTRISANSWISVHPWINFRPRISTSKHLGAYSKHYTVWNFMKLAIQNTFKNWSICSGAFWPSKVFSKDNCE